MLFHVTLKKLIDVSGVKLSPIANILGYDISYISKWSSGKKVPSYKNILEINIKLAEIFANSIIEDGKEKEFFNEFSIKNPLQTSHHKKKHLESTIKNLLNKSYEDTITEVNLTNKNDTFFIFEEHKIYDTFKKIIVDSLRKNKYIEIWTSFDINSPMAELLFATTREHSGRNQVINIHLPVKSKNVDDNTLYRNFARNPLIGLEIYDGEFFPQNEFLVIEDEVFMNFSLSQELSTMTYGYDESAVLKYFYTIKTFFDKSIKYTELASPEALAQTNFRKYFYSENKYIFYTNYGFEFLLPGNIIENIEKSIQGDNKLYKKEIAKIKILWREVFEKSNIEFIMPRSSLLNYIENGKIVYCSQHFTLDYKMRKKHFEHIEKIMKENENVKFYLLEDNAANAFHFNKFNIFANEDTMFFKNIYSTKDITPITVAIDGSIRNNILKDMNNLKNSSFTTLMSAQDMKELYDKYSNLFNKMNEI